MYRCPPTKSLTISYASIIKISPLKNYSKLRLGEKVNKIETHTKRVGGKMKTDWETAKSKHLSTKKKNNPHAWDY
jgi:hypothetical protein